MVAADIIHIIANKKALNTQDFFIADFLSSSVINQAEELLL